jgi:biopolymer transport protein ExbD
VTATFVRETGMEVQRPQAVRSVALEPASLRISITAAGLVYTEGRQVDLPELHQQVRQFLSKDSAGAVILIPDEQVPAGRLVAVMDVAKLAGARDIALATRPKGRP